MDLEGIIQSEIRQKKTNMVWFHLYVESWRNKLIEEEIRHITRSRGWERKNWREVVKRHKFPVIRQLRAKIVMYNMMTVVNGAV